MEKDISVSNFTVQNSKFSLVTTKGEVTEVNGNRIENTLGKWEFCVCDSEKDQKRKITIYGHDLSEVFFEKEYDISLSPKEISNDLCVELQSSLTGDNLESPKTLGILFKIEQLNPKLGTEISEEMNSYLEGYLNQKND